MKWTLLPWLLLLLACESNVRSDHRTGRHSIRCEEYVSRCHDQARELCPQGYLVNNRVRPQRNQYGTQFVVNIQCR